MTNINDIKIITVSTETQDEINGDATSQELIQYMNDNPDDFVEYDLGRYVVDQNDDFLGMHWTFLFNKVTGEILNGKYNTQL